MIGRAVLMGFVFLVILFPLDTHAANLGGVTNVSHGGRTLVEGDSVNRSDFSAISSNWIFTFSWPTPVANSNAMLAVIRGSYGGCQLRFQFSNMASGK